MDKKTNKLLSIILWVFLMWSSIYMLAYKGNSITILSVLIGLLCASLLFSDKLENKLNIKYSPFNISVFLDCALIYWIARIDISGASQILFFIMRGVMIIRFSLKYGLIFTGINFLSFIIIDYIKLGYPSLNTMLPRISGDLLSFGFVFGFSFVAKLEILQREKLDKTKSELERAYEKLQESYDTKEQLFIERERNKIAGEIHDTVGHTLTTVIVELEAAKRLIKKDGIKNVDKDAHRVLLRALQEGLTNGIRHGQSSVFKLSISETNNCISFDLSDNGCGAEDVQYGFGLSNMKHRVEQLKGILEVKLQKNKVSVSI